MASNWKGQFKPHSFELFDEGNKPIHGGVVVRVLKKGNLLQKGINQNKLQKGINRAKVNNKDQVMQNNQDAELHKTEAALQWQRPGGLFVMMLVVKNLTKIPSSSSPKLKQNQKIQLNSSRMMDWLVMLHRRHRLWQVGLNNHTMEVNNGLGWKRWK